MTTATEFSQTAARHDDDKRHTSRLPTEHGYDDRPVELNLVLLHHDPMHAINPLPWSVPEWLALGALASCVVGAGLLWVGW